MNINQIQGLVFVADGLLTEDELNAACEEAESYGCDLCAVLAAQGRVDEEEAARVRSLVTRQSAVAGAFLPPDTRPMPQASPTSTFDEQASNGGIVPPGWDPNAPTTRQQALSPALSPAQNAKTAVEDPPRGGLRHAAAAEGQIIGDYQILGELGRGGMGTVYEAFNLKLKQRVALKTLNLEHLDRLEVRERFQLEAETMAQFRHPNIVRVFDFGEDAGRYFLAMDLVEGRTLQDLIEAGEAPPPRAAAALILKIARALDYAHRRAVLHRDVKPDNILIDAEGEPRLTDFGLAKRIEAGEKGLTRTGAIMGTPAYMPPEQANGEQENLDHRADVYALGATLYAALTGRAVFESTNIVALMTEIFSAEPTPPSLLIPGLDRDLEVIVLKCLEKKPEGRYYTAAALADDLQRYLKDENIQARPPSRRERLRRWQRRHRTALLALGSAALVALLLLGGVLGLPAWRRWQSRQALERSRRAVASAADRWRAAMVSELDAAGSRAARERLALGASVSERCLDPAFLEGSLARWLEDRGLSREQGSLSGEDFRALLSSARRAFGGASLAARAALMRAGAYRELGKGDRVEAEQIRAFGLAPASSSGAAAMLALAERALDRGRRLDAGKLFEEVLARPTSEELRSRALYGLASIAIDEGDFDRAEALFKNPSFRAETFKDIEAFAWYRGLAKALHGRRVFEGPERAWLTYLKHEDRPVVLATRPGAGDTILEAYRLDPRSPTDELAPISSLSIAGRAKLQRMDPTDDLIFLEVVEDDGRRFLRWFRWQNGAFEKAGAFSMNEGLQKLGFIKSFGDFDGNGLIDLVLFARRHQFLAMNAGTPQQFMADLGGMRGSEAGGLQCLDLDGDGCDELITSANEWNDFKLFAYRGARDFARGGAVEPDYVKRLGLNNGIVRDPPFTGQRLLLSMDRSQDKDIGLIYGPDLSAHLQDAIWSLALNGGDWILEPLIRWPFKDRGEIYHSVIGRLDDHELPPHMLYHSWGYNRPMIRTLGGSKTLRFRVPGYASIVDADGDGDQELVFVEGSRFEILGLGGAAAPKAKTTRRFDEGSLTLLMLESGPSSQAEAVLELIAKRRLPAALEPLVRLAAAEAFGREGEFARARQSALAAAESSPALAREALLLAAELAERGGDLAAAQRDLEQARRSFARSDIEARRLGRRIGALAGRHGMKRVITLDAAALKRTDRPLELRGVEAFSIADDGLNIHADDQTRAGAAIPLNPQRWGGSPFEASCRLRIEQLDYDGAIALRFAIQNGRERADLIRAKIQFTGSGDPTSWSRMLHVASDLSKEDGAIRIPRTAPDQELVLRIAHRPAESRVEASVEIDGQTYTAGFTVVLPMLSDRFLLEVGPAAAQPGSNIAIAPRARIRATVLELGFDAREGLWGAIGARAPGSAGDALLRGDATAALAILQAAEKDLDTPQLRREAWRCRALIALRTNQGLAAITKDVEAFDEFWRGALPYLGPAARRNLRRILGLDGEPRAMLKRALRHLPGPEHDDAMAALAFDAAGEAAAGEERAGLAWHFAGDQARARELLAKQTALSPFARFYLGALACLSGEYERAIELWEPTEDSALEPALVRKREAFKIFCQRQLFLRTGKLPGKQ